MILLLALSAVPLILKIFFKDIDSNTKQKKWFLIVCGIFVVFVMGLRSRYAGSYDTNNYVTLFESMKNYPSLRNYLTDSQFASLNFFTSEVLFYIYVWGISKVFSLYSGFLIVTALIITVCTFRFFYLHSENVMLSVFMFITLGLMTFVMNGMRQAIAMSICLLSFRFMREKKIIPFAIIVIIATMFHKSAIFILPIFFVRYFKFDVKSLGVLGTIIALILIRSDQIIFFFDDIANKNYLESTVAEAGGISSMLIYFAVILMALLFNIGRQKENEIACLWLSLVGFILYICRYIISAGFERFSYYFAYYLCLLYPIVLNRIESKGKTVVTIISGCLFVALYIYRVYSGPFVNFSLVF